MWSRTDIRFFRLVCLLVLTVEVLLLGILARAFVLNMPGYHREFYALESLRTAVTGTLTVLALLTGYGLIFQVYSGYQRRRYQEQVDAWLEKWTEIVFNNTPPPPAPLTPAAVEALIRLTEVLSGSETATLHRLFRQYHLADRWLKRLQRRDSLICMEALEMLARLSLPETLPTVQRFMHHPHPLVRQSAARTAARILAWPETPLTAIPDFIEAVVGMPVSGEALEEVLSLTGPRAALVLQRFLHHPSLPQHVLKAVISVAGWLHLRQFAPHIALHLEHPEATIRGVCLRVLAQMERLPGDSYHAIRRGARDPDESVRVQAVRALANLPLYQSYPMFWRALHDESWWVRLAAAETLWQKGENGHRMLNQAAENYGTLQAGQVAQHVLANKGGINTNEWIWSRD